LKKGGRRPAGTSARKRAKGSKGTPPKGAAQRLRETWKQTLASLKALQARALRERQTVARVAEEAVQRALVALNIPSRQEVQELSRKVDELSRKIEGFRR